MTGALPGNRGDRTRPAARKAKVGIRRKRMTRLFQLVMVPSVRTVMGVTDGPSGVGKMVVRLYIREELPQGGRNIT
jgi:hypothetical protein